MKEASYREWVKTDKNYQKSITRAKKLGKKYEGLDDRVERIKQYEVFLKNVRNGKRVSDANAEDINAFVMWCARKKICTELSCRWTIVGYYQFLGNEAIGKEVEAIRAEKDWWQDLIQKRAVMRRFGYGFVKELHDLTMDRTIDLLERWDNAVRAYQNDDDWVAKLKARLVPILKVLQQIGVERLSDFVLLVSDQTKAQMLSKKIGIELNDLKELLRWIDWHFIPEQKHLGVLFEKDNQEYSEYVHRLATKKLASNLSLLDACQTKTTRDRIGKALHIPKKALTSLVHRADMSRHMCIARTVEYFTRAGFPTFLSIKTCDPEQFYNRVTEAARKCGVHKVGLLREFVVYTRVFPELIAD